MSVNNADAGRAVIDAGVYADALGATHAEVDAALSTLLAREMFEGGRKPTGHWAIARILPVVRQLVGP